jgi:hypothetical protein
MLAVSTTIIFDSQIDFAEKILCFGWNCVPSEMLHYADYIFERPRNSSGMPGLRF